MKLFSALYADGFPFTDLFEDVVLVEKPADLKPKEGVLIIWGGSDISPSLYGDTKVGKRTGALLQPSIRDQLEVALFHEATDIGMPILGICRGAQLACALLGGKVIQDVTNHAGPKHFIYTATGEKYITSSVHHQMLYPWTIEHELVASTPQRSEHHWNEDNEDYEFPVEARETDGTIKEPEIVYFPQAKCLGIQGHPEFQSYNDPFVAYSRALVMERLVPHAR